MLDFSTVASSFLMRSFECLDLSFLAFSRSKLEPFVPLLDSIKPDFSLLLHSSCRCGSALSVLDLLHLDFFFLLKGMT